MRIPFNFGHLFYVHFSMLNMFLFRNFRFYSSKNSLNLFCDNCGDCILKLEFWAMLTWNELFDDFALGSDNSWSRKFVKEIIFICILTLGVITSKLINKCIHVTVILLDFRSNEHFFRFSNKFYLYHHCHIIKYMVNNVKQNLLQ